MASQTNNDTVKAAAPEIVVNQTIVSSSMVSSPETSVSTTSLEVDLSRLTTADSFVANDGGRLSNATSHESALSEGTKEVRKRDRELVRELEDEDIPATTDASGVRTTPDPYHGWECGFGFMGKLDAPAEIPNNVGEFLQAVKGEIFNISCIQNGLTSYHQAITSGEHHEFDKEFLKNQTTATHMTIGQLFHISRNLQDVVKEVEKIKEESDEIKTELKEALAHAQPWIQRTRAILVSAHVFYKINYVLSSDKAKHIH